MAPLDFADWAAGAVGGSLPVAIPVALLAGLASFLSPCVLPLLPAYLSYASGLSAAEVVAGDRGRGRLVAGTALFVLGFAAVFVLTGAVFGGLGGIGGQLLVHGRAIEVAAGVLCVLLGLVFADVIPLGGLALRPGRVTAVGLAAAPLLGAAFAVGWTPCIGPTLGVVLTLALQQGSANRGAFLAFCYALGVGLPFLAVALAFERVARPLAWVKRHQRTLQLVGGGLLVAVGLLMVTGLWTTLARLVQAWAVAIGVPL